MAGPPLDKNRYLQALAGLMDYDLAVTVTIDGQTAPHEGYGAAAAWVRRRVMDALKRASRQLCGTRWYQEGKARPRAVGFVEHPQSNGHAHLAVKLPAGVAPNDFEEALAVAWERVAPGGTVDVQVYRSSGWLWYASKEWRCRRGAPDELDDALIVFA